eukprot:8640391-Heterocapsa_arctica.AAC.1
MAGLALPKHWFGKLRPEENDQAYTDCNKCYELVQHKVAAKAAVTSGCNSTVVKLSFQMYKKPRVVQVHKANTELIPANGGMLAGCGFAVHYLKAMIKED